MPAHKLQNRWETITCKGCDNTFEGYISEKRKFCSVKCKGDFYSKVFSGTGNPFYGKSHSKDVLERASKRLKGTTGESAIRWVKDRSKLAKRQDRNDSAYKDWRRKVWERDRFMCKIGNQDCCGKIQAHHILPWRNYPELRYEVNNGITLCKKHHPVKRDDESEKIPEFFEIIGIDKDKLLLKITNI